MPSRMAEAARATPPIAEQPPIAPAFSQVGVSPSASAILTAKNGLGASLTGIVADNPSISRFAIPVRSSSAANASPPRSYALRPLFETTLVSE